MPFLRGGIARFRRQRRSALNGHARCVIIAGMSSPSGAGRFDPPHRTAPLPPALTPRPAAPADAVPVPAPTAPSGRRRARGFRAEAWRWLVTAALFAMVASVLGLGILFYAIHRAARTDQAQPADAIVILGTAQFNGVPGPVLQARLDHALDLYRQGLAPVMVVTGGKMEGDAFTEAEAAAAYLTAQGVPPEAILYENAGTDTWQSLQGVAAVARENGLGRLLLVSDGFHLFRLKVMARDLGLDAVTSPAPDSPIRVGGPGERAYMLRELAALIEHKLPHVDVDMK